jgi:hypothetical protein
MTIVISQANQTVWDIALQSLGSVEGIFNILAANAFLRIDYTLPAGVRILIPDGLVIKPDVVDYYVRNNIYPATGDGHFAIIDPQNMVEIIQNTAYNLTGGNVSFPGERLYNLQDLLTVQINFSNISLAATAYVEQSLDGINFTPISGASQAIPIITGSGSITFNLDGLLTDYCRVRIAVAGATTGTIDEIIWRV